MGPSQLLKSLGEEHLQKVNLPSFRDGGLFNAGQFPEGWFDSLIGLKSGELIWKARDPFPISVLPPGGTIVSEISPEGRNPSLQIRDAFTRAFGEDLQALPELYIAHPNSRQFGLGRPKESCEYGWPHAMTITDRCYNHIKELKGKGAVLVPCGTDRMADLAMAVELMLAFPPVPIIFTGSQKTLDDEGNDVRKNLQDSTYAAEHLPPGVYIVFNNRIILARDAVKFSSEDMDAFRSHDGVDFGYVDSTQKICTFKEKRMPELIAWQKKYGLESMICHYDHNPNVAMFELGFGISSKILRSSLEAGLEGLVLKVPGMSGISREYQVILNEYASKIPILVSTRCATGKISLEQYGTGFEATASGAISTENLSPDAALIRLQILLAHQFYKLKGEGINFVRDHLHNPWSLQGVQYEDICYQNSYANKMVKYGYADVHDALVRDLGDFDHWCTK